MAYGPDLSGYLWLHSHLVRYSKPLLYPFSTNFLCSRTGRAYFPTVIDSVPSALRDGPLYRVCHVLYSALCSHATSDTLLVVPVARVLQAQVFGGSSEDWVYKLVSELRPYV